MGAGADSEIDSMPPSTYRFRVDGIPVAQPRHRASCRGGFAKMYLPKSHAVHSWKDRVGTAAMTAAKGVIEGAVKLDVAFVFKAPKKSQSGTFKISKPDIDNLVKALMDAITDAGVWMDDSQVVEIHAAKLFGSESAYAAVVIEPIDFRILKPNALETT